MNSKIMAIDYGSKKVGIASTDEGGRFALPRAVWPNDENLLKKVLKFKNEEGISKVILGESKNFDGIDNPIQKDISKFKRDLQEKGVEVIYHPELLTTLEAKQLQGKTQMTDASAAALILKSFIDTVYNKDA